MIVRLVLWSLADADATIEELRALLRDEAVDASADVEGLRLAAWISDEATERFGAVLLLESGEAAARPLPGRARELIGKDPDLVEEFDLEASAEGRSAVETLTRLGLAFDR